MNITPSITPTSLFKQLAIRLWPLLLACFAINILASIAYTSMPFMFAKLVDALMVYEGDGIPLLWPIVIAVAGLIYGITNRWGDVFVNKSTREASRQVLKSLHAYIGAYGVEFFQSRQSGRLTIKMTQIVMAIRSLMTLFLGSLIWSGAGIIIIIIQLYTMDWRLSLLMSAWCVACIVTTIIMFPEIKKRSVRASDLNGRLGGGLVDWFANMGLVKLFNAKNHETMRHGDLSDQTVAGFYKLRVVSIRMNIWIQIYYYLLKIGAVALIIVAWKEGSMTAAQMVAVYPMIRIAIGQLWDTFITNVAIISEHWGQIEDGLSSLIKHGDEREKETLPALHHPDGDLVLGDIAFTYPELHTSVLKDFSLTVTGGTTLGVVGESGAGKSTLAHLLMGLYRPHQGTIRLGDQVLKAEDTPSLRQAVSFVPQDTSLFHRSLMENIRYGRLDASDEEVVQAAKQAYAHDFISAMPQGYETQVGERGVKLSGGQRQRIAIARAILKDAPILILDEATSALDSESEALIQKSLTQLMKGKTVIVIAHRLSTLAGLERIIVMEGGRIVQDGRHDHLIKEDGPYARLWAMQSDGLTRPETP